MVGASVAGRGVSQKLENRPSDGAATAEKRSRDKESFGLPWDHSGANIAAAGSQPERSRATSDRSRIPELMVKTLVAGRLEVSEKKMSLGEFWRNVARVGGFIGRKSDGDPGWQTLWKGWLRVLEM